MHDLPINLTMIKGILLSRKKLIKSMDYIITNSITESRNYSDHIAIEETIRTEFFTKMKEAINRHGGEITIYDTIDLELARKP